MDRGRAVFTLPTGKLIMFEPGVRMAASLGQVAAGEKVSVRIKVGLRLADGRVFEGSASASATWINPDAVQLAAAQKEMFELLSKDTAGPGQRLSPSQSERLGLLIGNSDVSSVLTVEQALAAIRVYQQERRLRNFANPENAVGHILMLVNKRWSRDPATITFYRDALTTRSDAAISDFQVLRDVWDDSFVEPLLKAFEAGMLGMDLLGRHYSSWAKDATIPPRLSKAVLAHHPSLSRNATGAGASSADPRYALGLLGQTHDPTMIPLLRPFLADKTPTSAIAVPQRTPLRISEFASNAILWLLGEPERYRGAESGIGPSAYPGPQPPLGRMGQGDCGVGETPRRPAQASRVMKSIHSF
jgi:hypothetical protein